MKYRSFILIIGVILTACRENNGGENGKYLDNLKKYVGIQFPNKEISKYKQFVVIPNTGCSFCLNKASNLYQTKEWTNTLFISNRDSSFFLGNNEYNNVYLDKDEDLLNEVNLNLQGQPTVFQVKDNVEMLHLVSENWEDIYKKVKTFDIE